jgi:hypothetical protein
VVALPSVGPLALWCSQTLDEFFGVRPKTALGRCGELVKCTSCAARALVVEVAATARILTENGARPMVASLHTVPKGLSPEETWSQVGPKVAHAIKLLRERYVGGFEARGTLEIDAEGLANLHILESGRSSPRIGTVRRVFDEVGLGRSVQMQEEVEFPVSLACYTTKIPLMAFVLPEKGYLIALRYGLRLGGGKFSRATPGFYGGLKPGLALEAFAAGYMSAVIDWASTWPYYWQKGPPGLLDELGKVERDA